MGITNKCKCGCGKCLSLNHPSHIRYISGHNSVKHGDAKGRGTRLYETWSGMKKRCYNLNTKDYKNWGGRGIKVCAGWHEYLNFKKWALANGYADNLTIDRIENNGNYEPSNCQWITKAENASKGASKFTMGEAREIRKIIKYGKFSRKSVAKAYSVNRSTIDRIASNNTYIEEVAA